MTDIPQITHRYGPGVHVLDDPFLTTQLARLCAPQTEQPVFNQLVHQLYTSLIRIVISHAFPRVKVAMDTRMRATHERGVFEGEIVDRKTPTVVVDIARAGILPSQICYDTFNTILEPSAVRQDHLLVARTTDAEAHVTGAAVGAHKIGGPVDGCFVLFPDPMGATGNSLAKAIEIYRQFGAARRLITLNLVITPEFIRRLKATAPEVVIYALRLDRGTSPPEVLATVPGTHWDQESGLDARQYIVPGGGGFGELMNNSWI